MTIIEQIILTIVVLIICVVIVDMLFPDKNRIKQLPVPSSLSYKELKNMYKICCSHGFYEASKAFYFGFNECLFDFKKYKNGLQKDVLRVIREH